MVRAGRRHPGHGPLHGDVDEPLGAGEQLDDLAVVRRGHVDAVDLDELVPHLQQ